MGQLLGQLAEVRKFVELGLLFEVVSLMLLDNLAGLGHFSAIDCQHEQETQPDQYQQ